MVVAVKSLHNFSNSNPNDSHVFKEKLKVEFNAVLAIVGNFLNRTGVMEQILKAETQPLNWADYSAARIYSL